MLKTIASIALVAVLALAAPSPVNAQEQQKTERSAAASSEQHEPTKTFGQLLAIIWSRTWDDPVAFFTFVLACLTGVLAGVSIFQGIMLLRADKTARIAANAANLNSRAAVALELPIIRIAPQWVGFGVRKENNSRIEYCFVGSLTFTNHGRTKAFPTEVWCGWTVGNELPKEPVYRVKQSFRIGLILEPDLQRTPKLNLTETVIELGAGQKEEIAKGDLMLWFYCRLHFIDFMDIEHEVGFCWLLEIDAGKGTFRPHATPAYNRKT